MKNLLMLLSAALFIISMNSCASLSGFHTGKTVGKDNGEFTIALNLANAPDFTGDEEVDDEINNILFPNIELGGRYGVSEKVDIGMRLNTSLNILIDAKVQVVGDQESTFAMALGGGVGSFGLISTNGALLNFQVPVYTSYHPSETVALYLSPRYIGQFGTDFSESVSYLNYLGSNFGAEFGRSNTKFGVDIGYYSLWDNDNQLGDGSASSIIQLGLGFKFKF
jgi:hypothetical protein